MVMSVHLIFLSTTHLIHLIAITMSSKRQFDYRIGDRVAERPKTHGLFTRSPELRQQLQKYRTQRYGTVVGMSTRANKNGARFKVLLIQWDGLKTPSEHARMRICPASEIARLTNEVVVPGEM